MIYDIQSKTNSWSYEDKPLIKPSTIISNKDSTIALTKNRLNQKVSETSGRLDALTKTIFCLTFPLSCCWACVQVNPLKDVIVTRWGVVTDVLRKPELYFMNPIGLGTKEIDTNISTHEITNLKVNDSIGNPVYVKVQYGYQVVDSLKAFYEVQNLSAFIDKQAMSALRQVASQYPYDHSDKSTLCLKSDAKAIEEQLKKVLHDLVENVGVEVTSFRFLQINYDEDVQKLILAKQEAIAYINGRKKIANGAVGIVEETLMHLKKQGIKLNEKQSRALVTDLIYMISNQDDLSLRYYQNSTSTKLDPKHLFSAFSINGMQKKQ